MTLSDCVRLIKLAMISILDLPCHSPAALLMLLLVGLKRNPKGVSRRRSHRYLSLLRTAGQFLFYSR